MAQKLETAKGPLNEKRRNRKWTWRSHVLRLTASIANSWLRRLKWPMQTKNLKERDAHYERLSAKPLESAVRMLPALCMRLTVSEDEDEVPAEGSGAAGSADVSAGDSVPAVRIDGVAAAVVAKKEEVDDISPQRRGRKRLAASFPAHSPRGQTCYHLAPRWFAYQKGTSRHPLHDLHLLMCFGRRAPRALVPVRVSSLRLLGVHRNIHRMSQRQRAPDVERDPTHMRTHLPKKVRYIMGKLVSVVGLTTLQVEIDMPPTQVGAAADELEVSDELDKNSVQPVHVRGLGGGVHRRQKLE